MIANVAPLSRYTSFEVGGAPDRFEIPASEEELGDILRRCADAREPVRALGGGKNLLVDDLGVDGTVVSFGRLKTVVFDGTVVRAQAGASITALLNRAVAVGLAGLEGLSGVPGTVGGAVRMNAGGAHGEIAARVLTVRGFLADGSPFARDRAACGFVYRGSGLAGTFVTEVTLALERSDADLRGRVREILGKKAATQPLTSATAGCTFKNPGPDRSAGFLLDRAGVKGLACGGARYSPLHANFIENLGGATFTDIDWLIGEGRRRVKSDFGVQLELEVEVWRRIREEVLVVA